MVWIVGAEGALKLVSFLADAGNEFVVAAAVAFGGLEFVAEGFHPGQSRADFLGVRHRRRHAAG